MRLSLLYQTVYFKVIQGFIVVVERVFELLRVNVTGANQMK